MPQVKRDGYLLNNIPKELRDALEEGAQSRQTRASPLIIEILGKRYDVPYEAKLLGGREYGGGASLLLRLPPDIYAWVKDEANRLEISMRSVILTTLAEHFDLEPPSLTKVNPARRPGRPKHGRPRGRMKA